MEDAGISIQLIFSSLFFHLGVLFFFIVDVFLFFCVFSVCPQIFFYLRFLFTIIISFYTNFFCYCSCSSCSLSNFCSCFCCSSSSSLPPSPFFSCLSSCFPFLSSYFFSFHFPLYFPTYICLTHFPSLICFQLLRFHTHPSFHIL